MNKITLRKSLDYLVFGVAMILIFAMAARTPLDSDMWWHLRVGEVTWIQKSPVLMDSFSYTVNGTPWINHSWLSELGMYLVYNGGGFLAISGVTALLAMVSMGLVYFQMKGPAILRTFLLIMGSLVAALVWSPRPQLLSLVMLALTGLILFQYKWLGKDRLWWLLPLFVLWSNLHGGYPLGLLLIGCMLAGEILNHFLGRNGAEILTWRGILRLGIIIFLCALVVIINPNGFDIWRVPFQTIGVSSLQKFISEWASPDFHDIAQQPFLIWLIGLIAVIGLSKRQLDGSDLAGIAVFTWLALVARRNFGPFILVILPVFSRHIVFAIQEWVQSSKKGQDIVNKFAVEPDQNKKPLIKPWQRAINLLIVAFLGFFGIAKLYGVTENSVMSKYLQENYPVQAVNWIEQYKPQGNIINEYQWGGYLMWTNQNYPVFIDGRTDLYGDKIIGDWLKVVQADEGWQDVLARWKVDLVLLKPDREVVKFLPSNGWKLEYRDNQAVIFIR